MKTETKCSCGACVEVSQTQGPASHLWQARCPDCYDGADDAGEKSRVRGYGRTPEAAIADWQESHDLAHDL